MADNDQRTEITIGAKIDEAIGAVNQLQQKIGSFGKDAAESFNAATAASAKLLGSIGLILGAFAAAAHVIKEAVSETVKLGISQSELAAKLGTTVEEASKLNVAFGDVYSSSDQASAAMAALNRQIRTNEEDLNRAGLATREANGAVKDQKTLLLDAIQVINSYKQGTDRNLASQVFFRQGASELTNLLGLTAEKLEEASKKADELGLTMTAQEQKSLAAYRAAMNDVGDVMSAVQKMIGNAFMPVLTQLGEWFSKYGPDAIAGFTPLLKGVGSVFVSLSFIITAAIDVIVSAIRILTVYTVMWADIIYHAMALDWAGVKTAWTNGTEQIKAIYQKTFDDIKHQAEKAGEAINNMWEPKQAGGTVGAQGDKAFTPKDKNKMQGFETEFAELKARYEREATAQGNFQKFSLEMERDFWKSKIDLGGHSQEELKQLQLKYWNAETQIAREKFAARLAQSKAEEEAAAGSLAKQVEIVRARQQMIITAYGEDSKEAEQAKEQLLAIERRYNDHLKELQKDRIQAAQEHKVEMIGIERDRLQFMQEMGELTEAQRLQRSAELDRKEYEIKREALKEQIELLEEDKKAQAEARNELGKLDDEYQRKLRKNANDTTVAVKKQWEEIFSAISNAFETSVKGLILGTTTFRKAMANMGQAILGEFISMCVKMLVKWVATELAKTGATAANATTRTAVEATAAATGDGIAASSAIMRIGAKAWEAAAAVYASIAAIPIIGPFLAPAMAIGATALILGFVGRIASAAGGFDIGPGDNPITQLHEREMVLPAPLADGVRDMVAGGGGGGGVTVNFNGVVDGKRFFADHQDAVVGTIRRAMRSFK